MAAEAPPPAPRPEPPAACKIPEGLPVVTVDDLDGDSRSTGKDIQRALDACAARGGCMLQFQPRTYTDVAIRIFGENDGSWCWEESTVCTSARFPKGLVLRGQRGDGANSGTVLQSPLRQHGERLLPVVQLIRRPDIRLQIHDLTFDGIKQRQVFRRGDPQTSPGYYHRALSVTDWLEKKPLPPSRHGCLSHVDVRNFISKGIELHQIQDWHFSLVRVEDIGCFDGITPCPLWQRPGLANQPALRSAASGFGIYNEHTSPGTSARLTFEDITIRRTTKNGFIVKSFNDRMIRGVQISNLNVFDAGQLAFNLNLVDALTLDGARFFRSSSPGMVATEAAANNVAGVKCTNLASNVHLRNVYVRNQAGRSIDWGCAGPGNRMTNVFVSGGCRERTPATCQPDGKCYGFADFFVTNQEPHGGDLTLTNVEVGGTSCGKPFESGNPRSDIRLRSHDPALFSSCQSADADRDGAVRAADYASVVPGHWGRRCGPGQPRAPSVPDACQKADANHDGLVGDADHGLYQSQLGRDCLPPAH